MALVSAIAPEYRRRDVRVAIIVYRLLHEPFLTVEGAAKATLHRRGLLTYRRPEPSVAVDVVRRWLVSHGRITSGDYAALTGLTQPGALKALDRMARDGLLARGDPHGRNAHYVLRPDGR
jgi:ATP-dependent DNA helicase RecG